MKQSIALLLILFVAGCGFLPADTGPAPIYTYGSGKGVGSTGSHMVTDGDTLSNIARRYGLTVADLASQNGLTTTAKLRVGQRLTLPRPRDYKVKDGDTTRVVARVFEMSPAELARLNKISGSGELRPGQTLSLSREKLNALVRDVVQRPLSLPPAKPQKSNSPSIVTAVLQPVPKGKIFMAPVRGTVLTSYGTGGDGRQNDGVNIAAPLGAPVQAARAGAVVYAADDIEGYGNMILIKHDKSYVTVYAHLADLRVKQGDHVQQGQMIGTVGQTGAVTEPQLHFEIRRGKATENPAKYITHGL